MPNPSKEPTISSPRKNEPTMTSPRASPRANEPTITSPRVKHLTPNKPQSQRELLPLLIEKLTDVEEELFDLLPSNFAPSTTNGENMYQFGTRYVKLNILSDAVVCRTGGGYESFEEFLKKNAGQQAKQERTHPKSKATEAKEASFKEKLRQRRELRKKKEAEAEAEAPPPSYEEAIKLDTGLHCAACHGSIFEDQKYGSVLDMYYHVACFKCVSCAAAIQDSYCMHDKKPYCEECYRDRVANKCGKCQGILSDDAVDAMDEKWHPDCLQCQQCNRSVLGERFNYDREDRSVFCDQCWHCDICQSSLGDSEFHKSGGSKYCTACFSQLFLRCPGCSQPVKDDFCLEVGGKYWHQWCFGCQQCGMSPGMVSADVQFFDVGGKVHCSLCAKCAN